MNLIRKMQRYFHYLWYILRSLSYNAARHQFHYLDAAFEPIFWFVDKFARYLGLIFVIIVTILTSSVVLCWYIYLRPLILTYSWAWIVFHFAYGHYLLINILFHYYFGVFTSPGWPPQKAAISTIKGAVVCKTCIQAKPPRTHHCSICNQCFLKMDHHCPWMNNCIGFYNHRYFLSFCFYMWNGTIYVSFSSYRLFTYHFWHPGTLLDKEKREISLSFIPGVGDVIKGVIDMLQVNGTSYFGSLEKLVDSYPQHPSGGEEVSSWEHIGIIYLFLLCAGVTVALGVLNVWNIYMVCKGETSIEVHINRSEREKAAARGMGYNNPYDLGWRQNWKTILGLCKGVSLWRVFLPSTHLPIGDGLSWQCSKKPVNYPDPLAYTKYQKSRSWRRFCPC